MKRGILFLLVFTVVVCFVLFQPAVCATSIEPDDFVSVADSASIYINAVDGSVESLNYVRRPLARSNVTVRITHDNPFKYSYKIAVNGTTSPAIDITDFFDLFAPIKLGALSHGAGNLGTMMAMPTIPVENKTDVDATTEENAAHEHFKQLNKAPHVENFLGPYLANAKFLNALKTSIELRFDSIRSIANVKSDTLIPIIEKLSGDTITALEKELTTLSQMKPLPMEEYRSLEDSISFVDTLFAKLRTQRTEVENKISEYASLNGGADIQVHRTALDFAHNARMLKIGDFVKSSKQLFSDIRKLNTQITQLAAIAASFNIKYTRSIYLQSNEADVNINIVRQLRADSSRLDTFKLTVHVGEPRFTISTGFSTSFLDDRIPTIRTERRIASGDTSYVRAIRPTSDTEFKPSFIVLLNARIGHSRMFGTLGLVVESGANKPDMAIAPALSWNPTGFPLFFSVGIQIGKEERLAKGFDYGDDVPEELGDELPTSRDYTAKGMVSISYRIR